MSRIVAWAAVVAISWGCAAGSNSSWQRVDGTPDSPALREQRAKDVADCATAAGAPSTDVQSTMSMSREQVEACMRSKGWRLGPAPGE